MTYPTYLDRLQQLDAGTLAIGVETKSTPIGLVLAEYSPIDKLAKILSLFTVPEYRHQGRQDSINPESTPIASIFKLVQYSHLAPV